MDEQKSASNNLASLYTALGDAAVRAAFGQWLREQRQRFRLTQADLAVLVGGIQRESFSRVEKGTFRLGFDKLSHFFQPWAEQEWQWEYDPETGTMAFTGADPAALFAGDRVEAYRTLAHDGTSSGSHAIPDPTTALLLTQWEKLDTRDRAMVLSLVLRLAQEE